ncbi:hypothetical protein HZS_5017 [Henneguya salminicola]|nr:hypothetical protein HZS_5017 [Henneguya salminicola]
MDMITKLSFIPKTLYAQMIQKYTLKPLRIYGNLLNGLFENMEQIVLPMNSNTCQSFFFRWQVEDVFSSFIDLIGYKYGY